MVALKAFRYRQIFSDHLRDCSSLKNHVSHPPTPKPSEPQWRDVGSEALSRMRRETVLYVLLVPLGNYRQLTHDLIVVNRRSLYTISCGIVSILIILAPVEYSDLVICDSISKGDLYLSHDSVLLLSCNATASERPKMLAMKLVS